MRHFILPLLDRCKARAVGSSGRLAINPRQVGVLNSVFKPSVEEFCEVQEIVALARKASQKGDAIATRNGKMLDGPLVTRALPTLTRR